MTRWIRFKRWLADGAHRGEATVPFVQNRRRALVLVLTLWIVVVLTVIASSLAFDVQVNSKLALLQKNQFVAYNLAKAAVAVGMTHLQNDMLIDQAENPLQPYDALSDVWAQPERRDKDIEVEMGKGTYELEIQDEESKIDVNRAGQKVFKAMLEYYGYEPPDSDDIANAIIDFRDPDDTPTGTTADGGKVGDTGEKENARYSAMSGQRIRSDTPTQDLVYQCANESFLTTDELLDVIGITPELYYGYDPDSEEAKAQKIRDDIAMGVAVRERKSHKKKGLALKDIVTVRGSGRVNVNTASEEVLTILMYAGNNCQNMESAQTAAQSIVDFRGGRHGKAPKADDAFKSLADLQKVPGINQAALQGFSQAGSLGLTLAFDSRTFSVTGIGRLGSVKKTITAIVDTALEIYNPDDQRLTGNKSSLHKKGGFASRAGGSHKRAGSKEDDNYIRIPAVRVLQWIE